MKGLAGTGKTKLVMKYLMRMAGIKADRVLAFGHTDKSSKTIAVSITGSKQGSIETFLKLDDLTGTDLIVFDEVMGTTGDTFLKVYEHLNDLNEKRKAKNEKPIKMITLGDPTQITEGLNHSIENSSVEGITYINPLTTRFRSNVSAVVEIQDLFHDRATKVEAITAKSNFDGDLSKIPSTLVVEGAHVGGRAEMKAVLEHNKSVSGARSRVIIVANEAAKAQYQGLGADVLTYVEAQGDTWAEVYVDISRNDKGVHADWSNNAEEFNAAMYTATSRASDYVYVVGLNSQDKNVVDPDISVKKEGKKDFVTKLFNTFQTAVNDSVAIAQVFDLAGKAKPVAKPQPVNPTTPTQTPTNTVQTPTPTQQTSQPEEPKENEWEEVGESEIAIPEEDNTEEVPETETKGVAPGSFVDVAGKLIHSILAPSYYAVKSRFQSLRNGKSVTYEKIKPVVQPGSKAIYLALEDPDGNKYIGIFGENRLQNGQSTGNPEAYTLIGKMTNSELSTPEGVRLKAKLENAQVSYYNVAGNSHSLTIGDILMEGKVSHQQALSFEYQKEFNESSEDFIEDIITQIADTYHIQGTREEMKSLLQKNAKVQIFTHKEARAVKGNFKPVSGIPYLIFDFNTVETDETAQQTFMVRLSPKPMTQSDAEITSIQSFYNDLVKAQSHFKNADFKLGNATFNKMLLELKNGLEVVNEQLEVISNFSYSDVAPEVKGLDAMVTEDEFNAALPDLMELAKQLYTSREIDVLVTKEEFENAPEFKGNPNYELGRVVRTYKEEAENLYVVKNITDTYTDSSGRIKYKNVRQNNIIYGGPVVKALNKIARANHYVGGTPIRVQRRFKDGVKVFAAKSITAAPIQEKDEAARKKRLIYQTIRDILEDNFISRSRQKFYLEDGDNLEITYKFIEEEYGITKEDVEEMALANQAPEITEQTLEKLLSFDSNGNHSALDDKGNAFYLRKPVDRNISQLRLSEKKDRQTLYETVGSKFKEVKPTIIEVEIDQNFAGTNLTGTVQNQPNTSNNNSTPNTNNTSNFGTNAPGGGKQRKTTRRAKGVDVAELVNDLENKGLLKTLNC